MFNDKDAKALKEAVTTNAAENVTDQVDQYKPKKGRKVIYSDFSVVIDELVHEYRRAEDGPAFDREAWFKVFGGRRAIMFVIYDDHTTDILTKNNLPYIDKRLRLKKENPIVMNCIKQFILEIYEIDLNVPKLNIKNPFGDI